MNYSKVADATRSKSLWDVICPNNVQRIRYAGEYNLHTVGQFPFFAYSENSWKLGFEHVKMIRDWRNREKTGASCARGSTPHVNSVGPETLENHVPS